MAQFTIEVVGPYVFGAAGIDKDKDEKEDFVSSLVWSFILLILFCMGLYYVLYMYCAAYDF